VPVYPPNFFIFYVGLVVSNESRLSVFPVLLVVCWRTSDPCLNIFRTSLYSNLGATDLECIESFKISGATDLECIESFKISQRMPNYSPIIAKKLVSFILESSLASVPTSFEYVDIFRFRVN
jgi:hypothetical protein